MTSRRLSLLATRACLAVAASLALAVGAAADAGRETISIDGHAQGARRVLSVLRRRRGPTHLDPDADAARRVRRLDAGRAVSPAREGRAPRRPRRDPFVYPSAHHGFDNVLLRQPVNVGDARRGAGATVAYNQKAHEDSEIEVKRFLQEKLGR